MSDRVTDQTDDAPICPECGNRVPTERTKRRDDETFCTPLTCGAWIVVGEPLGLDQ